MTGTGSGDVPEDSVGPDERVVVSMTHGSGSAGGEFLFDDEFMGIQLDEDLVSEAAPVRDVARDALRNNSTDPVILVNSGGNPWRSGLFDCCQDPFCAIFTAICPCVTFGMNVNILDNGSTGCLTGTLLYMLLYPLICRIGIKYRKRLRTAFQIAEAPVSDRVAHRCFPCCAICQEFRELKSRGLNPFKGYRGLSADILRERNHQTIRTTPPKTQTMEKGYELGGRPGPACHSKSTFTYEEIMQATNGFSKANFLGQGGFGHVYRGVLPNGEEIAVKRLKARSRQGELEFRAEVEIISRVHHKHLVSLIGFCINGSQRLLVYEFVSNNNLDFHLHGKSRATMDWPKRLRIALVSAKGLCYLHEDCQPKIIHRDIKAANILLDFQFEAKVADFGLSKYMCDGDTHISTGVKGTFGYISPEYAACGRLTEKADVFSFGVVLLELITGRRPIGAANTSGDHSLVEWARPKLSRALEDGNFTSLADPKMQNVYDHAQMYRMVTCAAACIQSSADRRPKMSQIVRFLEGDIFLSDLKLNEASMLSQSGLGLHLDLDVSPGSSTFITEEGPKEDGR